MFHGGFPVFPGTPFYHQQVARATAYGVQPTFCAAPNPYQHYLGVLCALLRNSVNPLQMMTPQNFSGFHGNAARVSPQILQQMSLQRSSDLKEKIQENVRSKADN